MLDKNEKGGGREGGRKEERQLEIKDENRKRKARTGKEGEEEGEMRKSLTNNS